MGWRLLRADRLHFMTCSHRRSTAPRSGLRLHCDEKPCAPGERLPLKRRDRCLHSGKKTQTYLFYYNRSGVAAITPKHQESGRRAAQTPRRNSASAFVLSLDILFAWGGRGWASARFTYRNFVHLNTRRIFSLISHDSADSPAAASFCVFSGLTLFIVRDLLLRRPTINRETCFCCSHHRTSPGGAVTSLQTRYIQRFSSSSRGKKCLHHPPEQVLFSLLPLCCWRAVTRLILQSIYNLINKESHGGNKAVLFLQDLL